MAASGELIVVSFSFWSLSHRSCALPLGMVLEVQKPFERVRKHNQSCRRLLPCSQRNSSFRKTRRRWLLLDRSCRPNRSCILRRFHIRKNHRQSWLRDRSCMRRDPCSLSRTIPHHHKHCTHHKCHNCRHLCWRRSCSCKLLDLCIRGSHRCMNHCHTRLLRHS